MVADASGLLMEHLLFKPFNSITSIQSTITYLCIFIHSYIYSFIYEGEGGLEGEARLGVGGFTPWVSFTCSAW